MRGNALYYATDWCRYYAVVKARGGKSEEEISRLAGQVLVRALVIPVGIQGEESAEETKSKDARLRALLDPYSDAYTYQPAARGCECAMHHARNVSFLTWIL